MSIESDITNKLKEALTISCEDALYFSDDETRLIDAEYLLTVNAAKAIKELNRYFGEPYKIRLEHVTKEFATSCTPLFGEKFANNILGYSGIIRSNNDSTRPGKIDIAVYTTSNGLDNPLCAIEIKGFNPSKELINKDLERNAEYFRLTSKTGASTLPFTVFVALHSYKGVWNDEKEKRNIQKVRNRYEKYISDNPNLRSLHHNVDSFTIRRGVIPDSDNLHVQEFGLQGDEDYHFIGVVLTTKKIATNTCNK